MAEMSDMEYAAELTRNAEVVKDFLREHGEEELAQHFHVAASLVTNLPLVEQALSEWYRLSQSRLTLMNAGELGDVHQVALLLSLINRSLNEEG